MQRSFQHDQYGAGGIVAAVREAHAKPGTVIAFEVADHPVMGGKVHRYVAVGFTSIDTDDGRGQRPTWRYVGEGNELDGNGSSALIPTWYDDQSVEHAAAALVVALLSSAPAGACIFRVPVREAVEVAA